METDDELDLEWQAKSNLIHGRVTAFSFIAHSFPQERFLGDVVDIMRDHDSFLVKVVGVKGERAKVAMLGDFELDNLGLEGDE